MLLGRRISDPAELKDVALRFMTRSENLEKRESVRAPEVTKEKVA
jgi:hypothetical protein